MPSTRGHQAGCIRVALLAAALAFPGPSRASAPDAPDPFAAWRAGRWEDALAGFAAYRERHPGDAAVLMNIGSALYRLENWEAAESSFAAAVATGDADLRAQALYNLGNVAYRQGRLDAAVERYEAALAEDPDDEDAKFNLELARRELRRRQEEARRRRVESDARRPDRQETEEREGSGELAEPDRESEGDEAGGTEPGAGDRDEGEAAGGTGEAGPQSGRESPLAAAWMDAETARRLLAGLEEGRPRHLAPQGLGRRSMEKDW